MWDMCITRLYYGDLQSCFGTDYIRIDAFAIIF